MATTQSFEESTQRALEEAISSMEMLGAALESSGVDPLLLGIAAENAAMLKQLALAGRDGTDATEVAALATELRERTSAVTEALAGNKEKRRVTTEALTLALKAVGVEKATWPEEMEKVLAEAGDQQLRARNLVLQYLVDEGYGHGEETRPQIIGRLWKTDDGRRACRSIWRRAATNARMVGEPSAVRS